MYYESANLAATTLNGMGWWGLVGTWGQSKHLYLIVISNHWRAAVLHPGKVIDKICPPYLFNVEKSKAEDRKKILWFLTYRGKFVLSLYQNAIISMHKCLLFALNLSIITLLQLDWVVISTNKSFYVLPFATKYCLSGLIGASSMRSAETWLFQEQKFKDQ